MEHYIEAITTILNPTLFFPMLIGVTVGLLAGALPGISATMAMALFTPLTYSMDKSFAFALLCAIYVGALSGGLYSAILLRIPGTNASIATTFDGFPLARQGKAPETIGVALISSFIGSYIGFIFLATCAPLLAKVALKFGAAEYFAVSLLGLSTIASLVGGNVAKGMISAAFGLMLSTVGIDGMSGLPRFTFGSPYLTNGITLIAILIGFFAVPQILKDFSDQSEVKVTEKITFKRMIPNLKELFSKEWLNFLRSALIGTWIGVLPGAGSTTAALIAYDAAKKSSSDPDSFGKGNISGVIAPETANNAVIGTSYIPMLTLGIPGDSPAAVMLAALTIHGLQAGPMLFQNNPGDVSLIITAMWISGMMMIVIAFFAARYIIRGLSAPKHILLPIIFCLCCIGAFAANKMWFDLLVMIVMGMLAFCMGILGVPMGPAVLGLVLGKTMELNLRRAIQISNNGITGVLCRPLTAAFLLITLINLLLPVFKHFRALRSGKTMSNSGRNVESDTVIYGLSHQNMVCGGIFALLSLAYMAYACTMKNTTTYATESVAYDPGFFPKVVAVMMLVFSVILVFRKEPVTQTHTPVFSDRKRAAIQIALMLLYPLCMIKIGFIVSTLVFLVIEISFIGRVNKSKWLKTAIIAVVVTLLLYILLELVFKIFLPHGLLY